MRPPTPSAAFRARLAAALVATPLLAGPPAAGAGTAEPSPAARREHPAAPEGGPAAPPAGLPATPAAAPPAGDTPSPAAALAPAAGPAAPPPPADPWAACGRAIAAAERGSSIPAGLLLAIARVESGRPAPGGGVAPWPFAINADGQGRFPASRAAAIAEVEALRARGTRLIDVGCMQVNLFHHPAAFPTLELAFDPATNVAYAARFLRELHGRTGNWAEAVAQYHSQDPARGLGYQARVRVARVAGGTALTPAQLQGLCEAGRRATLVVAPNGRVRLTCGAARRPAPLRGEAPGAPRPAG